MSYSFLDFLKLLGAVGLFLYADHKPWMGDSAVFYRELGVNLDVTTEEGFRNYYSTWYLFWANDAAKEILGWDFTGRGPDLSPCFLMDHLFQKLGWTGSDYMQAQREVTNVTNELLQKNAEALHQGSVNIAKEAERGIVDIETIKKTNIELIQTLDEVRQIQDEGRAKRMQAEEELAHIEGELKAKLLSMRG